MEFDVVSLVSPPRTQSQDAGDPPDPPGNAYGSGGEGGGEGREGEMLVVTQMIPAGMHFHVASRMDGPRMPVFNVAPSPVSIFGNPRRGGKKRKKGKRNVKRQRSILRKFQSLMLKLNLVPFIPFKILDFPRHEKLLKSLGLWDFVHVDFDRKIRADLIAQLVASYDPKMKYGYANDFRISVCRSDFARAFKLPLKKNVILSVDLDEESILFVEDFVSDWVLLHDDVWIMPPEVVYWLALIKEGFPERVDWAGLLRLMVERELMQGDRLRDCFYASHLQYLLKFERGEMFFEGNGGAEKVDLGVDMMEEHEEANECEMDVEIMEEPEEANECEMDVEIMEEPEDVNEEASIVDVKVEECCAVKGSNIELNFGHEGEKAENVKDVHVMDLEKPENDDNAGFDGDGAEKECKEKDVGCDDDEGVVGKDELVGWIMLGKNNLGEHSMDTRGFCCFENREDEPEVVKTNLGEDDAPRFDVFPDGLLEDEGITGKFRQAMKTNKVVFSSQERLSICKPFVMDVGNDVNRIHGGKRATLMHDNDASKKRLRVNDSRNNKSLDFAMCTEQLQQACARAGMMFSVKEQQLERSNMNQHGLFSELLKLDEAIEHLHKAKFEEMRKKDREIYRRQRELYLMRNVLEGYKKALKDTQNLFAEYRRKDQQSREQTTCEKPGFGDFMLSSAKTETMREKEDVSKMMCLVSELKKAGEHFCLQFEEYAHKISSFDTKLGRLEAEAKKLIQSYAKRELPQTEEKVQEPGNPFSNE